MVHITCHDVSIIIALYYVVDDVMMSVQMPLSLQKKNIEENKFDLNI